jgi:xanthine dehydrogenase iron-sulfur cluster and FAD-binding subunit A
VDHAPKPATEQSVAQAAALQVWVSAECGHAAPPNVGSTVARLRCCEPVPHDLVLLVQALKAEVAQCTGHEPCVHACVSVACGHTVPPLVGCTNVRERLWKPARQDALHVPHAVQEPMTHGVAHVCVL